MGVRASKVNSKMIIGGTGRYKRLGGGCPSPSPSLPPPPPPPPPRGYVPICVGVNDDTRRFIVHTTMLGDADFLEFLYKSAEEYGFCNQGVLRIPYKTKDFEERIIKLGKPRIIRV
ncbi:SAUR-like auxin-responsive protein family [Tripterygium wilfordii]|uniref:SAUR-like auxin-responsive protein family n=1 Tax=Tripterygium wilfordii TaxID=458696 RepID=A0A7J7CD90_TRIWF|nr:SAUR-like auxin-responsive protein family [Tripterygium wilfordii]